MAFTLPPIEYFNILVIAIKDRNRVIDSLVSYLDDYSEIEGTYGKQMVKIKGIVDSSSKQTDALVASGWESIYRYSLTSGKEHSSLAANLSSSVIRSLQDSSRIHQRTVQNIVTRTTAQNDELRKLIKSNSKNRDAYVKLIQEAEATIRARDALKESEAKSTGDNMKNDDKEGFFTKITKPNLTRLHDRCHDLIREIKESETQLSMTTNFLNATRKQVMDDYRKATIELIELDKLRLNNLHESLNQFVLSEELIFDRLNKSVKAVNEQVQNFENKGSIQLILNSTPAASDMKSWEETLALLAPDLVQNLNIEIPRAQCEFFVKVEKVILYLDTFRNTIHRSIQTLGDIIEAERNYCKSSARCFDRHGYSNAFASGNSKGGNLGGKSMNFGCESKGCIELFTKVESPSVAFAWGGAFRALENISEDHTSIADTYSGSCLANLSKVLKKADENKFHVKDVLNSGLKRIEVIQQNLSKDVNKLLKVRKELSSRRRTLSSRNNDAGVEVTARKGEDNSDVSDDDSVHSMHSVDDIKCVIDSGTYDSSSSANTPTSPSNYGNRSRTNTKDSKEEDNFFKNKVEVRERTSFYAFKSAVTEAVRTSKLGAGLGMESAEERYTRIEGRVAELEEEERSLIKQVKATFDGAASLFGTISEQLTEAIDTVKVSVDEEIVKMKSILIEATEVNLIAASRSINNINDVRCRASSIVLHDDMKSFIESLIVSINEKSIDESAILDLPPLLIFGPIVNEIVEEERRSIRLAMGTDQDASPNRNHGSYDGSTEITDTDDSLNGFSPTAYGSSTASIQDKANTKSETAVEMTVGIATNAAELTTRTASSVLDTDDTDKEEFSELKKFSLPAKEKVIQWYSCAIYPKRGMLTHGTMYVTQSYLCFQGWPEIKVVLEIKDIAAVTKSNSVIFIANCVVLTTYDGVEYSFGSFTNRDSCYDLVLNMVNVKKGVSQALKPANPLSPAPSSVSSSQFICNSNNRYFDTECDKSVDLAAKAASSLLDDDNEEDEKSSNTMAEENNDSKKTINTTEVEASPPQSKLPTKETMSVSVDIPSLYKKNDVIGLEEELMPFSVTQVFKEFWEKESGWRNYLLHEGDLDVKCGEWKRTDIQRIPEDSCKLPFHFTRLCTYAHPRTTMLMFGPKNAPATMNQYLCICEGSISNPAKFIVVSVTQFVGIPMTEMFKVVQYWCHERSDNDVQKTIVRLGLRVFFIKHTMFRSQILSGTKEEVGMGAKKWCKYMSNLLPASKESLGTSSSSRSIHAIEAADDDVQSVRSRRGSGAGQEGVYPSDGPVSVDMKNSTSLWSHLSLQNIIIIFLCVSTFILAWQQIILTSKIDDIVKALNAMEGDRSVGLTKRKNVEF